MNSKKRPKINVQPSRTDQSQLPMRQDRIRTALMKLSREKFVYVQLIRSQALKTHEPRIELKSTIRVRGTNFYFQIWEDFRDFDTSPYLHGFKYCLRRDNNPDSEPLFRYECHPDTKDKHLDAEDNHEYNEDDIEDNNYGLTPHYHPDKDLPHPIPRLHYPFHRMARPGIIFGLIAWLDKDMVQRFYESGRVVP